MGHPNSELIDRFYDSFARKDAGGMAECYAPDVSFSDPVFRDLDRDEATSMWRMFCEQGTDLEVSWGDVRAGDDRGQARWEARYTFGPTGRRVVNRIAAEFLFEDGKIRRHVDDFDFYRWARMALGPPGLLLGWTPMLRNKVRTQARRRLHRFMGRTS